MPFPFAAHTLIPAPTPPPPLPLEDPQDHLELWGRAGGHHPLPRADPALQPL